METKELFLIPIPKVASSALRKIYDKNIDDINEQDIVPEFVNFNMFHFTAFECRKIIKDYHSFCFVRNPWDRLVSSFKWERRIKEKDNETFKRFVKGKLFDRNWKCKKTFKRPEKMVIGDSYRHAMIQSRFIYDLKGNVMVDFIGRFENLQEDHDNLMREMNLPIVKLPRVNQSRCKTGYKEFYDTETREIVAKHYEEDIDNFKYTF
jgi:chondroitin 4-sulfotransferase 11